MTEILKQLLRSKTIIKAFLTTLTGVLAVLISDDLVATSPSLLAALIALNGIADVVLRFLTTKPVGEKVSLNR